QLQVDPAVLADRRGFWLPAAGLRHRAHAGAAQEPPDQVEPHHRRAAHAPDHLEHAPAHKIHRCGGL
ncbi:hypothetical protein IWW55_001584, partial [Coemansia sp. RSA 2706]